MNLPPEIDRDFLRAVAPHLLIHAPKIYVAVCCDQTLILVKPALACGGCSKPVEYVEIDSATLDTL